MTGSFNYSQSQNVNSLHSISPSYFGHFLHSPSLSQEHIGWKAHVLQVDGFMIRLSWTRCSGTLFQFLVACLLLHTSRKESPLILITVLATSHQFLNRRFLSGVSGCYLNPLWFGPLVSFSFQHYLGWMPDFGMTVKCWVGLQFLYPLRLSHLECFCGVSVFGSLPNTSL